LRQEKRLSAWGGRLRGGTLAGVSQNPGAVSFDKIADAGCDDLTPPRL
jgi:hypothetical protein